MAPLNFRLMQMACLSILSIGLFWKIPRTNFAELTGYIGFVFYCVSIQLFVGILGSILVFIEERPIFLREQASRMYGVVPYYLAKDLIELPVAIMLPFLFSLFYLGMGTDVTLYQFSNFYLIQFLVYLSTSAYGQVIGSLFGSAETACFFAPVILMPFMMFSGFLTNLDTFPRWIGWIQYLSPIRYGFEAGMRNEFEGYHLLPINIANPIKFLNFKIGFNKCMILLFITTIFMKVIACLCLKKMMSKF